MPLALIMAAAATLSVSSRAQDRGEPPLRPPNIIFIMADDLGYGELGCYGQEKVRTPNIDRLANEGMRFTQYYTASPVCAPARCSLMTGLHGGHARIRDNSEVGSWDSFRGQLPLEDSDITIAECLKSVGYATGAFGKWGLGEIGSSGDPLNQGFDRFFGYNCQRHAHNYYPRYLISDREEVILAGNDRGVSGAQYAPQRIADELLSFIRESKDGPFFVYYPTIIPHLALQVPDPELAPYLQLNWPETRYTGTSYQPHETPRAAYAAMITFLDKQVGRILDVLDELDLADDTIIFFTSDNGPTHVKEQVDAEFFRSTGGLRGRKGSLYEGGIRVPMIVRWSGQTPAASESMHLAAHYDMLATLCEIAGVDTPPPGDGISFAAALLGRVEEQAEHGFLVWDFAGYGGQTAIRSGQWKAIWGGLRENPSAPAELYDLASDQNESNDVAADHPDVVAILERTLLMAREEPEVEQFRFGEYE